MLSERKITYRIPLWFFNFLTEPYLKKNRTLKRYLKWRTVLEKSGKFVRKSANHADRLVSWTHILRFLHSKRYLIFLFFWLKRRQLPCLLIFIQCNYKTLTPNLVFWYTTHKLNGIRLLENVCCVVGTVEKVLNLDSDPFTGNCII